MISATVRIAAMALLVLGGANMVLGDEAFIDPTGASGDTGEWGIGGSGALLRDPAARFDGSGTYLNEHSYCYKELLPGIFAVTQRIGVDMDTIGDVDHVTKIEVFAWGAWSSGVDGRIAKCRLYVPADGPLHPSATIDTGSEFSWGTTGTVGGVPQWGYWDVITFNSLNLTQAQLDGLRIEMIAFYDEQDEMQPSVTVYMGCMYIKVTYEAD